MSLTVTVKDNETGDERAVQVPDNEYFLVVNGSCYVAHTNVFPKAGTAVVTIKGRHGREAQK